jgi:hypothetical protein
MFTIKTCSILASVVKIYKCVCFPFWLKRLKLFKIIGSWSCFLLKWLVNLSVACCAVFCKLRLTAACSSNSLRVWRDT